MNLFLMILFFSVFPFGAVIALMAILETAGKPTLREAYLQNPFFHIWWAQSIILGTIFYLMER